MTIWFIRFFHQITLSFYKFMTSSSLTLLCNKDRSEEEEE
jgi:hypothetical protein